MDHSIFCALVDRNQPAMTALFKESSSLAVIYYWLKLDKARSDNSGARTVAT